MVNKRVSALVVSSGNIFLKGLRSLLRRQGIEVCNAKTCEEASRLLHRTHPELIFTATELSDGTWTEIVSLT